MYARPVNQLRRELNQAEFLECTLALEMGLLPDPWRQSGTIAAAAASAWGARVRPDDFIPRLESQRTERRSRDGRPLLDADQAERQMRLLFG